MDDPIDVALQLAAEASGIMSAWFAAGTDVTVKTDGSPVTQADLEINALVLERIAKTFPDHGFIGEELSGEAPTSYEYVWVCDPLDGTRPFSIGLPLSTFALALLHNGKPILGVIAWPFRNWVFAAELGSGAVMNGERLRIKEQIIGEPSASQLVDILVRSHLAYAVRGLADELDDRNIRHITLNSTAICAGLIASGRMAGSVWSGDTPWDAAAGKLIVEEAGGIFTNLHGGDQRYDQSIIGSIAGTPSMHAELLEAIGKCGVARGTTNLWSLLKPD